MAENKLRKVLLYRTSSEGITSPNLEIGEVALNYNANSPFLMFKDSSNAVQKVGALVSGTGYSEYVTMTQKAVTDALDAQKTAIDSSIEAIEEFVGMNADEGETAKPVSEQIQEAIEDLDVDSISAEGSYIASVSQTDGKIAATTKVLVKSDDSVLSYGDDGIFSKISIKKLETTSSENVLEEYKLVGNDGSTALGETIKVYKDQNLKSVALVSEKPSETEGGEATQGQFLEYVYVLANGDESTVYVDVSAFLTEAEYGDGLKVVDHVISAKLGEDTETNKNFLDLEGDVEGEKALAVRSVDTDKILLQKDITVAGFASQFGAGNYSNGNVILAGTDIYTILQNILCKELYPEDTGYTVTSVTAKATAYVTAPKITLDKTGTQEVGTLITMASAVGGTSSVATTASSVSNMIYGYSLTDDDIQDSTNSSITKSVTTAVSDSTYTLSAAITGFNADATTNKATTPTTVTGDGGSTMASTILGCVVEGTNTIKVNETGTSYTYKADAIDSVYYCSNLGNTDAARVSTAVSAVSSTTSKPTNSATTNVTGVYKYFMGYSTNTTVAEFDSASVRALTTKSGNITKDGTTTIVGTSSISSNGTSIVVACPSKYKLATVTNGLGADIMGNFSVTGTVEVATGAINTTYNVYIYPITNGAEVEFKGMTLTKA